MIITNMSEKSVYYTFKADTSNQTMEFFPLRGSENDIYKFSYKAISEKDFLFKGIHLGDSIQMKTSSKSMNDYLLTKSGIRWVTDLESN